MVIAIVFCSTIAAIIGIICGNFLSIAINAVIFICSFYIWIHIKSLNYWKNIMPVYYGGIYIVVWAIFVILTKIVSQTFHVS